MNCVCYKCWSAGRDTEEFWFNTMNLCPTCGNKRCPGAADHENECSGSNEPGQPGSLYPALDPNDTRTIEEKIADLHKEIIEGSEN